MPLQNPIDLVPGTHVWFAAKGATLSAPSSATRYGGETANVVGPTVRPSYDDQDVIDTTWLKFGDILVGNHKIDRGQGIKRRGPSPAKLKLKRVIYPYVEHMWEFTLQDVGRRALQLAYSSLEIDPSDTQFTPNGGDAQVEGWLRIQILNYDGSTFLTLEEWVSLVLVDGLAYDAEKLTEPKFQATLLDSPLNTAGI